VDHQRLLNRSIDRGHADQNGTREKGDADNSSIVGSVLTSQTSPTSTSNSKSLMIIPNSNGNNNKVQTAPNRRDNYNNGTEYPDLLDIPNRSQESPMGSSTSTVPEMNAPNIRPSVLRLPHTLEQSPMSNGNYDSPIHSIYQPLGRPHSPYAASVASFTSEPATAIIPPANRPGYVTLPRRPRAHGWNYPYTQSRLSRGSSPTGSVCTTILPAGPRFDTLGLRTTADGSSRLSLNKIGEGVAPTGQFSSPNTPAPMMSSTLGRPSARRSVGSTPIPRQSPIPNFNFAPIQELETTGPGGSQYNEDRGTPLATLPKSWRPQNSPSGNLEPIGSLKKVPPKPPPKPSKKPQNSVSANLREVREVPEKVGDTSHENSSEAKPVVDDGTEV